MGTPLRLAIGNAHAMLSVGGDGFEEDFPRVLVEDET